MMTEEIIAHIDLAKEEIDKLLEQKEKLRRQISEIKEEIRQIDVMLTELVDPINSALRASW